jgi:hypothetical protein
VDFNYEISRSLAACDVAILVVEAAQGIKTQTLANVYLILNHDLDAIPSAMSEKDNLSVLPQGKSALFHRFHEAVNPAILLAVSCHHAQARPILHRGILSFSHYTDTSRTAPYLSSCFSNHNFNRESFSCLASQSSHAASITASGRIDFFQSIRPLISRRPMDFTSLFSFFSSISPFCAFHAFSVLHAL